MKIQSKNLKFNQKLEYFHPCSTIPIPPMCIIHGWNVCSKKLLRTPSRLMIFITNLRSKWQILFCALSFNFYRVIDQVNHCSIFYWRKRCKIISKIKTYIIFFIKIFKWQVCRTKIVFLKKVLFILPFLYFLNCFQWEIVRHLHHNLTGPHLSPLLKRNNDTTSNDGEWVPVPKYHQKIPLWTKIKKSINSDKRQKNNIWKTSTQWSRQPRNIETVSHRT